MAQKRLSDFFLSVSKRTRNENEDETVEQLEEMQDEKDKQELRKGNRLRLPVCYEKSDLSGSSCIPGWTIRWENVLFVVL